MPERSVYQRNITPHKKPQFIKQEAGCLSHALLVRGPRDSQANVRFCHFFCFYTSTWWKSLLLKTLLEMSWKLTLLSWLSPAGWFALQEGTQVQCCNPGRTSFYRFADSTWHRIKLPSKYFLFTDEWSPQLHHRSFFFRQLVTVKCSALCVTLPLIPKVRGTPWERGQKGGPEVGEDCCKTACTELL